MKHLMRNRFTGKKETKLFFLLACLFILAMGSDTVKADELNPAVYILIDTSGSMLQTVDGTENTYGDGSLEHPHYDPLLESRMYMAKNAISTVVNAYGEVMWGMSRFEQMSGRNYLCMCSDEIPNNTAGCGGYGGLWAPEDECRLCDVMADYPDYDIPGEHDRVCINYGGGLFDGCTDPISGLPLLGADILVPIGPDTKDWILSWVDHSETDPGDPDYDTNLAPEDQVDPELRAVGGTPLGGALFDIYDQLSWEIGSDDRRGCRPYSVILLTDGAEECGTDPIAAADELLMTPDLQNTCTTTEDCPLNSVCSGGHCRYEVKTHVIAFAVSDQEFLGCQQIGVAGNTGGAIPAESESEIVSAMAGIIASSIVMELCNGIDDNCNGLTDEDYPDLGDTCDNGLLGQCYCSGTMVCTADELGTECSYDAPSETNPCGSPAEEECNGLDDNCDGITDNVDPNVYPDGCDPPPDLCDPNYPENEGLDDPRVGVPCGSDLGECEPGITICENGHIVCEGEVQPEPEICDGKDNNCDGITDGLVEICYTHGTGCGYDENTQTWSCEGICTTGISRCQTPQQGGTGTWGVCEYQQGPEEEVCDGRDNNCNGLTDEDENGDPLSRACYPPGSGVHTGCIYDSVGETWNCEGECKAGVQQCISGAWQSCIDYVSPQAEVCNNLDDNCDGQTDEPENMPGLGQPCGLAIGRCTQGILQCIDGQEICEGGEGPFEGECNGLDDNCDGVIDDPDEVAHLEGEPCGTDVGECEPGETKCVGGEIICIGGRQPTEEICNGLDDDCDGVADNGAVCPPNSYCYEGACRPVCDPGDEFGCPPNTDCISVYIEIEEEEIYLCLPRTGDCGGETCPDGWICVDEECVDPCEDVECEPWEECTQGVCMDQSCTASGIDCPPGEFCINHECMDDPCIEADCDPDTEYCIRECDETSCSYECGALCKCPPGQRCNVDGDCVEDLCHEVECSSGNKCNPETGVCETDECYDVTCSSGEVCYKGECIDNPCVTVDCPHASQCILVDSGDSGPTPMCRIDPSYWNPGADPMGVFATGKGGCGCRAAGSKSPNSTPLMAILLLSLMCFVGVRSKEKVVAKTARRQK